MGEAVSCAVSILRLVATDDGDVRGEWGGLWYRGNMEIRWGGVEMGGWDLAH